MTFTEWLAPLIALVALEIVLGIDNIIFLAIIVGRLPHEQQARARRLGLGLALGLRLLLLFFINFLMGLTEPIFHLSAIGLPPSWIPKDVDAITGKDLILILGGLFLIAKSVHEIHERLEGPEIETSALPKVSSLGWTLVQIGLIDVVFSLDSVITAVGIGQQIWIMVVAMILAVLVMLVSAGPIGDFVHRHPTLKILALSFLILIGVVLLVEGFGQHISRGYIYFAMAFAFVVEMLNLKVRGQAVPVQLHEKRMPPKEPAPQA